MTLRQEIWKMVSKFEGADACERSNQLDQLLSQIMRVIERERAAASQPREQPRR